MRQQRSFRRLWDACREYGQRHPRRVKIAALGVACAAIPMSMAFGPGATHVVLAWNDLGMHCMQSDFSEMMILPPFNTLRAQVIRRGAEPSIVTSGLTVSYQLPTNTSSTSKTNFWEYDQQLLGVNLPADVGLAGFGMAGTMARDATRRDFAATGIPVTPIDDDGKENPYPMALVTVRTSAGAVVAQTQAVVPVSWEMSCNVCHNTPGKSVAMDILEDHDRLHGTTLVNQKPVMCASCHSDNALGAPGVPGVSTLSSAMHSAHATRMATANLDNACYACHPGFRTNCQRDVHALNNVTCVDCHGDMAVVGNTARNPWVDEPRCSTCHTRAGFEFEQPGVLYRNSIGHRGVQCTTCHGSPHAMGPAATATDNAQAMRVQGHAGVVNTCTVCHTSTPSDPFPHRANDD